MTSATRQETDPTHFSWIVYGNFSEVLPGWEKLPDWLGNMLLPPYFSESTSVSSSGHCDDLAALFCASLPGLLDKKCKCIENHSSVGFLGILPFNIFLISVFLLNSFLNSFLARHNIFPTVLILYKSCIINSIFTINVSYTIHSL